MGHDAFAYRERHAFVHDLDIATLRHFLLLEAENSGNREFAEFIRGWKWIGVGVYLGLEFDAILAGDPLRERDFLNLLDHVRVRLQSFGESIPLDYLDECINSNNARFTDAQPVDRFIRQLDKLAALIG